jgi:hypothetical protein
MNNETEKLRGKKEQGTQDPTGSVDISNKKGGALPTKESQSNPPQDISKKNPPQGTNSHDQDQQKIEDEKRRAS